MQALRRHCGGRHVGGQGSRQDGLNGGRQKEEEKRGRHEVGQVAYMKMDMVANMVAEINIYIDINMETRLVRELVTGVG